MENPTQLKEWQALISHHNLLDAFHMRDWFNENPNRFKQFSLEFGEIFLDFSRNRIQPETLQLLCDLANAVQLRTKIEDFFAGSQVNPTEKRPALHTALRDKNKKEILVNGKNIVHEIDKAQEKIRTFVNQIHQQTWRGITGKPIQHIVNIGIGGSHHGPLMATEALKDFAKIPLQFHFVSSVDKTPLNEVLAKIDPEQTLFIISSKSFTTTETLTNARTILSWLQKKWGTDVIKKHFIAITAAEQKALDFGITQENIFPLWDWIGGRYSIWSAIGIPIALMLGNEQFAEFLDGAHEMDMHFREADFAKNMPVLLALISIWYLNFFGTSAHAIIPYSHRLRHLVPYIQQAQMESNGKSVGLNGVRVDITGPVIFGEEGCNGQHTYHQLLHQGCHLIPVDFILVGKSNENDYHQDALIASGLSQAQALMRGKTYDQAYQELIAKNFAPDEAKHLAQHQVIPGNRPSNILFLERLTPKNLGTLLALYEHQIFVQSVIWNINPFDQWGVELGKQLLPSIVQRLSDTTTPFDMDCATEGLINRYKKIREML